jgi:hypothetical protein
VKTIPTLYLAFILIALTGCQRPNGQKKPVVQEKQSTEGEDVLLTVDFQEGQSLRYKFVSSRNIEVDWDPTGTATKSGKKPVNKTSETLEMVVEYTPTKVDPYGLTTIKATCKSVNATRSQSRATRSTGRDAVETLRGKRFTFAVGPTGKISHSSEMEELIKEAGEKAFRRDESRGRIKEPDMISDFIAAQWFLWDSLASVEDATEGVSVGQSWRSKLLVPTPMVTRKARDVTYTLHEIRESEKGRLAVIKSSYAPAQSAPKDWPVPYSGTFRMSGTFGFLRGYKLLGLDGRGQELFNIDKGRIEKASQKYQLQMAASLPLPLGTNPKITIEQSITTELMAD